MTLLFWKISISTFFHMELIEDVKNNSSHLEELVKTTFAILRIYFSQRRLTRKEKLLPLTIQWEIRTRIDCSLCPDCRTQNFVCRNLVPGGKIPSEFYGIWRKALFSSSVIRVPVLFLLLFEESSWELGGLVTEVSAATFLIWVLWLPSSAFRCDIDDPGEDVRGKSPSSLDGLGSIIPLLQQTNSAGQFWHASLFRILSVWAPMTTDWGFYISCNMFIP